MRENKEHYANEGNVDGKGEVGLSLGKQWLMPAVVIGKVSLLSAVEFEKRIRVGVKWDEMGWRCVHEMLRALRFLSDSKYIIYISHPAISSITKKQNLSHNAIICDMKKR